MRNRRSPRPKVATAGAISATFVVHDTSAPIPSITADSAVNRRNSNRPPRPIVTVPTWICGLPPANVAVIPTITSRAGSQRGNDGSAPRGIRASHTPAASNAAISPIVTHPGDSVNNAETPKATSSLVPAHSSWMTERPGTGRSRTTGRRGRRLRSCVGGGAGSSLTRAATSVGSSRPSRRCSVRGHSSSSPLKSCEITTTVRPV
jgi:hypothetical protein